MLLKLPIEDNVFREFLDHISKDIVMRSGRDNEKLTFDRKKNILQKWGSPTTMLKYAHTLYI